MFTLLTSGCSKEEEVETGSECCGKNWDQGGELGLGVVLSTHDLGDLGQELPITAEL